MADNENYIENIQFGEDEEIYPIRDAEAVEKEGGELADTIVTYEDEETTVSSFTDFISNFISGSKVAKWFKDFRAGVEYILHVGSLVNNCVTDNAQLPLSAAQGKVLMDELTSVKSDLTELSKLINISSYVTIDSEYCMNIGYAYCLNNVVYICLVVYAVGSTYNVAANIASPYRPPTTFRGWSWTNTSIIDISVCDGIQIGTDGNFQYRYRGTTDSIIHICCVYPLNN